MGVFEAVGDVVANLDDRYWWRERFQDRVVAPVLNGVHGTEGVDVVDEDWDNLLVLDACRADMFEAVADVGSFEEYRRVRSAGSSSPDWIAANFAGRSLGDVVYVTANPWVAREAPASFRELVDVWSETAAPDLGTDALESQDLATSPTTTVTATELNDAVRSAFERHPNKRFVVHYFQPHAPCIGRRDGSLKSDAELDLRLHPGEPLSAGRIDRDAVWSAYEENLGYVLEHARQLAAELGGKTVFTADHGELFGERLWPFPLRGYAHPQGLHHPALVTVPWAEQTAGERREITEGETSATETGEAAVTDRLEDLGYL